MTQFQFDPDGMVRVLRQSKVSPSQSTQAAQFQQPQFNAPTTPPAQPAPQSPEAPGMVDSFMAGFGYGTESTITAAKTTASVLARNAIPRVIGSLEQFAGSLLDLGVRSGLDYFTAVGSAAQTGLPIPGVGFVGAQFKGGISQAPATTQPIDLASALLGTEKRDTKSVSEGLARIAVSDAMPEEARYAADILATTVNLGQALKDDGKQVADSYLTFDPKEGRWATTDFDGYVTDILGDPYLQDPGRNAGLFVGNALSSVLPAAVAVARQGLQGPVMASYFAMGYADAANQYEEDAIENGQVPDEYLSLYYGLAGGAIELALEGFSLKEIKRGMASFRKSANARMASAIEQSVKTGSNATIRTAAARIAAVLPSNVKTASRVLAANALEEAGVAVANNTIQLLTYDPVTTKDSYWSTAGRMFRGVPEAALGGAIGGAPFAGAGMISGPGREETRLAAREEAARIRGAVPPVALPVPAEAAPVETEAAPAEAAAPARTADDLTGDIASPDVAGIFDRTDKDRANRSLKNARMTGEAPAKGELARTQEEFLSAEYTDNLVAAHPEFAIALLRAAQRNGGVLSRGMMPLVYQGSRTGGRTIDQMDRESRANFVNNLRRSIRLAKAERPLKDRPDVELREMLRNIGRAIRSGTATQEQIEQGDRIQRILDKRASERNKKTESEREALAIEDEVARDIAEEEAAAEPEIVDDLAAAERAIAEPAAEPPAVEQPAAEEPAAPEPAAETAAEISPDRRAKIEEIQRELQNVEASLESVDPEDADTLAELQEQQADLEDQLDEIVSAIQEEVDRLAEEASPEPEPEPVSAEPDPIKDVIIKGPDDVVAEQAEEPSNAVKKLRARTVSLEQQLQDLDDQIAALTTKNGNPKRGKKDEREALIAKRPDLLAKIERAKAAAKTQETKEKVFKKPKPKAMDSAAEEKSGTVQGDIVVDSLKDGSLGIIGEDNDGKSLLEVGKKRLLNIADAEGARPANKDMRPEDIALSILGHRLWALGFTDSTLRRLKNTQDFKIIVAPRNKGEKTPSIFDVINIRRHELRLKAEKSPEQKVAEEAKDFGVAKKIEGRKAKTRKITKAEKQQAKADLEARREAVKAERIRRLEAAQEAVNPGGIGVLRPGVTVGVADTRTEQERVRETFTEAERARQGLPPQKPVEKLTKAEAFAEIVDDIYEGAGRKGRSKKQIKLDLTNEFRAAGIKVEAAGGKAALLDAVRRIRSGKIARPRAEVDLGKAKPLTELGKVMAQSQRRADAMRFQPTRRGSLLRAQTGWRRQAELDIAKAEKSKASKGVQERRVDTSLDDKSVLAQKVLRIQLDESDASSLHAGRFIERILAFESGEIIGDQSRLPKRARAIKSKVWGVRITDRINIITGDLRSPDDATFPDLTDAIMGNLDPNKPSIGAPEEPGLKAIDRAFKTDFARRFDPESPVGLALDMDIRAIINDSVLLGDTIARQQLIRVNLERQTIEVDVAGPTKAEPQSIQEQTEGIISEGQVRAEEETRRDVIKRLMKEDDTGAKRRGKNDPGFDEIQDELDNDVAFSLGAPATQVIDLADGGAEILEDASRWLAFKNLVARITGKVSDTTFGQWLTGRVAQAKAEIEGQQVSLDEANSQIEEVIKSQAGRKEGLKSGDLVAVPDSEANPAELAVIRRMRRRGRTVVLYRANTANGVAFNGFVSRDNNTIYVRVGSLGADVFNRIQDPRARRLVRREYERIILQIVRHENTHLLERDEANAQEFTILADTALDIATGRSFSDGFNNAEEAAEFAVDVLGMSEEAAKSLAATAAGRKKIVSELRAEAASQIDALRRSGAESLYTDRNIIERTMDRIRRAMTKAGFNGRDARAALAMAEVELKINLAESGRRVEEARSPKDKRKNILFSADLDIRDTPIFDYSDVEPQFSIFRPTEEWRTQWRENWQDRNIRLRKVTEDLEASYGKLPEDINPMQLIDIGPGLLARRSEVFMKDQFLPLFEELERENLSRADMGRYLHALHAIEANRYLADNRGNAGVDSGMTDAQAFDIMQEIEGRSDGQKYKDLAEKFQEITKETLRIQRDAGLITQDDYDNITSQYKFYVPLADPSHDKAIEQDDEPVAGLSQIGRAMFFRKGRDKVEGNIIDNLDPEEQDVFFEGILIHIGTQRARVIRKAIRNDGLNRLLRLGLSLNGSDKAFTVDIGPRRKDGSLDMESLRQQKNGATAMVVRVNRDMVILGKPFAKGEQVVIRSKDPNIGRILNTNAATLEDLIGSSAGFFRKFTAMKRALATRYNIEFTLVNPVRDLMEASASLRSLGYGRVRRRLASNAIPAFRTVWKYLRDGGSVSDDPEYQEYLDSGAPQNFYRIQDAQGVYEMVEREARRSRNKGRGISWARVKDNPGFIRSIGKFLDNMTNSFDDGVRFAAWKIAKEEGMTTEQATALSRDITVDFSRRGNSWGSQLNEIYAFSNVGIQGVEKNFRKSGRVIRQAVYYGIVNSLLCSLAFDDDDWEDIPDYVKSGNFIIPLFFRDDDGKPYFLTIPKPFGIGTFVTAGQSLGDVLFRRSSRDAAGAWDGMARIVESTLAQNPFGGAQFLATSQTPREDRIGPLRLSGALQAILPDIADPAVTLATGYDWAGRRVFPRTYSDNEVRSERGFKNTPDAFKNIAETVSDYTGGTPGYEGGLIDFTPEFYQFVFHETLFGPAKLVSRMTEMVKNIATGQADQIEPRDIPIFRRFADKTRPESTDRRVYYDFDEELAMAKSMQKIFDDEGLKTIEEASVRFERSEEDIMRNVRLLRFADDPKVKQARSLITRKLKDAETKARSEGDIDMMEKLEDLRDRAYKYIADQYKENGFAD